jgi:hypothetical protein
MGLCVNACSHLNYKVLFHLAEVVHNMASSDGSDSDEEMVACQVCIIKFNQVVKKPKYLDCKVPFFY